MSIDIEKAMEAAAGHLEGAREGDFADDWVEGAMWEAAFDLQLHLAMGAARATFPTELVRAEAETAFHPFVPRYKANAVTAQLRMIAIPLMLEVARLRGFPPRVTDALLAALAKAAGDAYDAIAGMLDPAEDDDTAATLKHLVEAAGAKSAATGRPVRVFTGEFGDEGDDE